MSETAILIIQPGALQVAIVEILSIPVCVCVVGERGGALLTVVLSPFSSPCMLTFTANSSIISKTFNSLVISHLKEQGNKFHLP